MIYFKLQIRKTFYSRKRRISDENRDFIYFCTPRQHKKVAAAMAQVLSADLIDLSLSNDVDLSQYDLIGLASGCFYHNMHEKILDFARQTHFPTGQKIFLLCTCGTPYRDYTKSMKKILKQKGVSMAGSFQCRGFDTFGPFAKIGGIAKGHPNEKDLAKAREWAGRLKTDRG